MMAGYLLFATERYALPILAPLAQALHASGQEVAAWFEGGAAGSSLPGVPGIGLKQALAMRPRAVFSAANWVPTFLSGAKVQLFHGFNVEKRDSARGHFRVRGMFDLYCTQGPATTAPFRQIADQQGHFAVAETGWPKLDPLFRDDGGESAALRAPAAGRPVILFGSTFTERLSAAPHLLAPIAADIAAGERYWLLTLHPKCPPDLFERYRALAGANARFIEPEQVMAAQRAADVLVSDTSSIVSEFIVQHKPVVTFRNRVPKPHMIDFDDATQLPAMLQRALHPDTALRAEIVRYADAIHPYRDGRSSERVITATEDFLSGEMGALRRKPFGSWVRDLQIRKDLGYWGPSQR
ncbi:TPA: CDP-glycerol glycerophosphotransferase family protein [Stenotrophomonas maltophilia]|nr:CDP-glycerol glycerophosphotransferase family protein [Stenotrophomonas maltophilia]HDS1025038.1 CDP-glycerol glycerophosphotransferase family protein [Stenotrophomonas maltophilia]HDS1030158.1 CDP-glycerol glycerophosphotransferase family protein [Stenotrophomonas maltophilia]HDS1033360.1 CDP-glycerol glycerophosphotransferase family protein [Stenotrophomonas maltophilia]HDS1038024.1 CDP-glycerol glycerophosphotransferase family protein [Stenotrophomonas maltophilia]